jgi:hypothetical protein
LEKKQQVPPLRYVSVGMTILLGTDKRTSRGSFSSAIMGPQAHDCFGMTIHPGNETSFPTGLPADGVGDGSGLGLLEVLVDGGVFQG